MTPHRLRDLLEQLIVAIEWEVPPIRDGVDVDRRLDILLRHAEDARKALTPTPEPHHD